jgi:hypothetical protein
MANYMVASIVGYNLIFALIGILILGLVTVLLIISQHSSQSHGSVKYAPTWATFAAL